MSVKRIASWVVAVLLFLAFLGAGAAKLTAQPMMVQNFAGWNYPSWFMYLTGALEVAGAILVLIPRTALYGAGLIGCIMVGAMVTLIIHGPVGQIGAPIVLLVLALFFAWLRGFQRAPVFSSAR